MSPTERSLTKFRLASQNEDLVSPVLSLPSKALEKPLGGILLLTWAYMLP